MKVPAYKVGIQLILPLRIAGAWDLPFMGEQALGSFFSIENKPFGLTEVFLH